MAEQTSCPVCGSTSFKKGENPEAHIAACIESRLAELEITNAQQQSTLPRTPDEGSAVDGPAVLAAGDCPICDMPFEGELAHNLEKRERHIRECIESFESAAGAGNDLIPTGAVASPAGDKHRSGSPEKEKSALKVDRSSSRKWFAAFGGEKKSKEEKMDANTTKADALMASRWGPEGSENHEMVMRYWRNTRMEYHWRYLAAEQPRNFHKYLKMGYMEPIPLSWIQSRALAYQYPEGSYWETPAEKRLYYFLNNGVMPDGRQHVPIRPLNINRNRAAIIKRGNERNARQVPIDPQRLAAYRSAGDVFHSDKQIKSQEYSYQVPNTVSDARRQALHELADGIVHGTDHLETMLLIDVSGSMTWNPHSGVIGPDGVRRYHDQPSNIDLTKHLVYRVLHHMIARAQKEHPHQNGIPTVAFSTYGNYVGQLSTTNFQHDWRRKIRLGGGTQVMQGWQTVKKTYFEMIHAQPGHHGRYDPLFGWQPTPGMPKLSLLVFLDGEAMDMDEFELELLGESWAYVTICLVGMENCPHHHSHAVELERVARFNPHVAFFDCHGRVCERLVVEEVLGQVYPVDPPTYEEILRPEFDIGGEELPAYSA